MWNNSTEQPDLIDSYRSNSLPAFHRFRIWCCMRRPVRLNVLDHSVRSCSFTSDTNPKTLGSGNILQYQHVFSSLWKRDTLWINGLTETVALQCQARVLLSLKTGTLPWTSLCPAGVTVVCSTSRVVVNDHTCGKNIICKLILEERGAFFGLECWFLHLVVNMPKTGTVEKICPSRCSFPHHRYCCGGGLHLIRLVFSMFVLNHLERYHFKTKVIESPWEPNIDPIAASWASKF